MDDGLGTAFLENAIDYMYLLISLRSLVLTCGYIKGHVFISRDVAPLCLVLCALVIRTEVCSYFCPQLEMR